VGRKVGREGGSTARLLIVDMRKTLAALQAEDPDLRAIGQRLASGIEAFERATEWIVINHPVNPGAVAAGSVYYLMLAGYTIGGWMMARSALAAAALGEAGEGDPAFLRSKRLTARFFADHLMPQATSLAEVVMGGADSVLAAEESFF
jgi:hypothetical protein